MFASVVLEELAAAADGPLWMRVYWLRRRDAPAGLVGDPAHIARLSRYLGDLLRPFGLEPQPDVLAQGQSYGEMAASVLGLAVAPGDEVDLLVPAFATPDITPGRATATYLGHVCPGTRLAFAICDQGAAAAFTGLRLVGEYLRTGDCRRGLLVVVEQAAVPYPLPAPAAVGSAHTAVTVLCDSAGRGPGWTGALETVRVHADVASGRAAALLAAEVAELSDGCADVTLSPVRRPPQLSTVDRLRIASPAQPYTGVWYELAGELADRKAAPGAGRVLLADYDPTLRYLCVAAMDVFTC